MKQNDYIIIGLIGAGLWYWWKHQPTTTPPAVLQPIVTTLQNTQPVNFNTLPTGVSIALPETTGTAQLIPTPATIMDITSSSNQNKNCTCCNLNGVKYFPHII